MLALNWREECKLKKISWIRLHENIFDVLKLAHRQIHGQLEMMLRQTVDGSQRITESGVSDVTMVGVILLNELLALINQIQPLG